MGTRVYEYYAVFTYEDEGITITFPDLPGCISCGYSTDEAINMAHEALHLYLDDMKETEIPRPSKEEQIVLDSNQKTFPITVQMGH
ncbi:type II toxin-antitoxin system HicB family antitoxin [Alicyclobacillus fastidiosus]|uniref:Type II toxin-antitoxin system HicB family antitoxin n=1 Tax=Alicyclobacillus fastidiosus TaxID=392011 RepID=A0ABV5AJB1_9BACL|nr:type II toxin-antitoxin system HicB family antitoxin [Alicyclobacillus fastidiosus]WEH09086.1 type II toxin-antitoxin system HicB family antitoxin [Alicyclobacillus fastidiosus]